MNDVWYVIEPRDPHAHLFHIRLTIDAPDPAGQRLFMPAWIPGSYMIRDFARHVVAMAAHDATGPCAVSRLDKSTWQLAPADGPVTVEYDVYAWDLSVRAAHFDQHHAYFNGSSVFLAVVGQESQPCTLDIMPPAWGASWRVATSLQEAGATRYGFGRYRAPDYDALIDHPVEMADFTLATFNACGVPHDIVISGRHDADMARLCEDLTRICEAHIRLFETPAPFDRYVFIVWAVGEGYGGLEHRASTSLITARDDLPTVGQRGRMPDGYRTFLGLCSHEYFHTWNVKRIKPAGFMPYDLRSETYTRQLWAFEGITSYYDDLILLRSGVIDANSYLELLGQNLTRLARTPGRHRQSVTDSSFDAWTRFYKQDENSPNAIVSYYLKGGLIALGLDGLLRRLSDHALSLDDVMRTLWRDYALQGRGVPEGEIEGLAVSMMRERFGDAAADEVDRFMTAALHGMTELPLEAVLGAHGITVHWRCADGSHDRGGLAATVADRPIFGAGWSRDDAGVRLTHVFDRQPAQRAGLSAGDLVFAIDGLRVDAGSLERRLARRAPGDTVRVHAFRRDEMIECMLELQSAPQDTCYLTLDDEARARRWWGFSEAAAPVQDPAAP